MVRQSERATAPSPAYGRRQGDRSSSTMPTWPTSLLMVIVLLGAVTQGVAAQSESIAVPYVSRLRTTVQGDSVKLLWQDSSIAGAKYVIYRAAQEITAQNLDQADKLGVVPAGQQSYVDHPPDKQPYFYAVLVEQPSGTISKLVIPFRNVTTEGAAVQSLAGQQPHYADVTSLKASHTGTHVMLTFKTTASNRELIVYRDTAPIADESDLLNALSVGVISSSQSTFEDNPVAGIPYYYAIIDSGMLTAGKVLIIPGENATTSGATIPMPMNASDQIEFAPKRPRPLPFLNLNTDLQTGSRLPGNAPAVVSEATPLAAATSTAVKQLLGALQPEQAAALKPVVLDPEQGVIAGGGEEYNLKRILDGPFAQHDWTRTISELTGYLSIRHSPAIASRARFYLGQAYYFAGDYRSSYLEFLFVDQALYAEVQPWTDALFLKLGAAGPSQK